MSRGARQRLKSAGLQATANRARVLGVLERETGPRTAAELLTILRREGSMDRVTLYRTLEQFSSRGIALKSADGEGAARYCLTRKRPTACHGHVRCLSCGEVECVDIAAPVGEMWAAPALREWTPGKAEVLLTGQCPRCGGANGPGET